MGRGTHGCSLYAAPYKHYHVITQRAELGSTQNRTMQRVFKRHKFSIQSLLSHIINAESYSSIVGSVTFTQKLHCTSSIRKFSQHGRA